MRLTCFFSQRKICPVFSILKMIQNCFIYQLTFSPTLFICLFLSPVYALCLHCFFFATFPKMRWEGSYAVYLIIVKFIYLYIINIFACNHSFFNGYIILLCKTESFCLSYHFSANVWGRYAYTLVVFPKKSTGD